MFMFSLEINALLYNFPTIVNKYPQYFQFFSIYVITDRILFLRNL